MTETDLVTAGGSAEQAELPNTVNTEFSSPEKPDVTHQPAPEPNAAAKADSDPAPKADAEPARKADVTTDASKGSLSSMVLPELRALANSVGVKGASGMRKSELIAAIRESRGESVNNTTEAPKAATPPATTAVQRPRTRATDDRRAGRCRRATACAAS